MRQRLVKQCKCGYELTESTKRGPSKSIKGKTKCPDCGGDAKHFMYVDVENVDEERVSQAVTRLSKQLNNNGFFGARGGSNPIYDNSK